MLTFAWSLTSYSQQDSVRVISTSAPADTLLSDSTKVIEDAALDIAQNRGLFIVTPDRKLQLRILGSVRFLAVYDNRELPEKNSFSTFDIPVGIESLRAPNLYMGLEQTRLGFEATRRTDKGNNVFVRLETDFAGPNGFRIRHAYGQFGNFLFGQTWSLFSQIVSVPATVDFNSPTGTATARTPQIRYSRQKWFSGFNFAAAAEYFRPEVSLPDSLAIESFLLIPDVTARIDKNYDWGLIQFSGLLTFLSGRNNQEDLVYLAGWGGAFSAIVNSWASGKWYFQTTMGKGISRYFNDLGGLGLDLLINPVSGDGILPFTSGTFLTYEHDWTSKWSSNFTYGALVVEKFSASPERFYRWGDTFRVNTFWSVVDGAKFGFEWIYGIRNNVNSQSGSATRFNFLVYYDF